MIVEYGNAGTDLVRPVYPIESAHPELYHYTTLAGLKGILRTQTLWATNYRFLNDASEVAISRDRLKQTLVTFARDILISLVVDGDIPPGSFKQYGGLDIVAEREAESLINASFKSLHLEDNLFITSFCGTPKDAYVRKNGLLSQWRAYGRDGGFCIEFRCRDLIDLLKKQSRRFENLGGHVSEVVYSDDERLYPEEFENALADIRNYFRKLFIEVVCRTGDVPDIGSFIPAFMSYISRYKHRAFKEEVEVRAVWVSVTVDDDYRKAAMQHGTTPLPQKPIQVRENGSRYISLFDGLDASIPINRIIVGPQKDQPKIAKEIEALCAPLGILVECSDIPLASR